MLKGCQGFIDSGYGEFVGVDIEVSDCVLDELTEISWDQSYQSHIELSGSKHTVAGSSSSNILAVFFS